jgi:hypothetical protein
VIGMMAAHTSRLIPFDARPSWARLVLLFEPLIPSLFLLLVGLSLSRSFEAARMRGEASRAWYTRQARRAAGLWAISVLFFVAEYGVRIPDALLGGGILAVIAYAILGIGALMLLPRASLLIGAAFVAGCATFAWMDATGRALFPLNTGGAPILPMTLFALAGALLGRLRSGRRAAMWILAVIGGGVAIWLITRHGAEALFTKPFGRSDAGRDLPASILPRREALHVGFYDLKPVLATACLGLQLSLLAVLGILLRNFPERIARFAFAPGRHALAIYVGHLAFLAAVVTIFGEQPLTAVSGTWVWVGLILVWQSAAFLLEQKKRV